MIKFIVTLTAIILANISIVFSQIAINHSVIESPPYTVGDTITIQYNMFNVTSQSNVRSVWLRTQYSNKHLELIPNLTVFAGGQNWQTYQYQWVGYRFNHNPAFSVARLDDQYYANGWAYALDNSWNVNQLNFQSPSNIGNIIWATQRFIVKDQLSYFDIHKLDIGDVRDLSGASIRPLTTNTSTLSLSQVNGAASSTTIKIHAHSTYDITKHSVRIYNVNSDNSVNLQSIVATLPINSSGEIFTTLLQTGKSYYVEVLPITNQSFLSDVITVTDAFKGFLQISDRGLNLEKNYFTLPLEFLVGDISNNDKFDKEDAYILFAYISGLEIPSNYSITSATSTNAIFVSGLLDGFAQGQFNNIISIIDQTSSFDFAYAWGGDLDFSHSTPVEKLTNAISNKLITNSITNTPSARLSINTNIASQPVNITSKLENNKVIVNVNLNGTNLAGTQFKLKFDNTILELENITFDAGSTITNYNTIDNYIIKFGSIDVFGSNKLKTDTTYKLVFKSNKPLANATGLIFIDFAEGVSEKGNKIKLIVN
jgi:hypothetical protein